MKKTQKLLVLIAIVNLVACKPGPMIDSSTKFQIRWIETYGSTCCPRDPQHANHIRDYIDKFELENNVNIIDTYYIVQGKESEATYYLTLNGLTSRQRKKFVLNRYQHYSKKTGKQALKKLKNPVDLREVIRPWTLESVKKYN